LKAKQNSKTNASIVNLFFNYANASFAIINGLVLVPLYLTYFSVGTYGSYLASGNIVGMLGLLEGGMAFVLTQKLSSSYAKKDLDGFSKILGSGLFISVSIAIVLFIIGLAIFPFISEWVKAEPNQYKNMQYAFLYSAIGAGLNIIFHNISAVFQALLKVSLSGFINLISIFFGITITLLGLQFGLGVVAIPLGILVRGFVGVSILIFTLIRILKRERLTKIQITKLDCSKLIKSVLPMFGGGVAKSLVTNSQLLIITNFISPTASAVFFITGRIYQVCDSFLAPIGSSIFSSISQIVGEGDRNKVKKSIIKVFSLFNGASAFILSTSLILNYSFVSLLLGSDKYGGMALSFLLCINMLFYTRFNFISVNLYALGVFGKTILYDVLGSILRLIIIFILIRYIGYLALPLAELFSTLLLLGYFLNMLIIKKLDLDKIESKRFFLSGLKLFFIMFSIAIPIIYLVPKVENWYYFIAFGLLLSLINGILILIFSKQIREIVLKLINKLNLKVTQ
jgi:O-antigen/teichoic acid export membrane protein